LENSLYDWYSLAAAQLHIYRYSILRCIGSIGTGNESAVAKGVTKE